MKKSASYFILSVFYIAQALLEVLPYEVIYVSIIFILGGICAFVSKKVDKDFFVYCDHLALLAFLMAAFYLVVIK